MCVQTGPQVENNAVICHWFCVSISLGVACVVLVCMCLRSCFSTMIFTMLDVPPNVMSPPATCDALCGAVSACSSACILVCNLYVLTSSVLLALWLL